jgi:hypothetical protein
VTVAYIEQEVLDRTLLMCFMEGHTRTVHKPDSKTDKWVYWLVSDHFTVTGLNSIIFFN